MLLRSCLMAIVVGALAACASPADDREWMKINEKYSGDDFRRDVKACSSSGGTLDDTCMRARGWVDVSKGKSEAPQLDRDRSQQGLPPPRSR